MDSGLDVEMQIRCIYCKREQYAPAVYPISYGECGCCWCGGVPPILNTAEYHAALKEGVS